MCRVTNRGRSASEAATGRFIKALFNLRMEIEGNPTEQALKEVGEFLDKSAEKIEELGRNLREGKLGK